MSDLLPPGDGSPVALGQRALGCGSDARESGETSLPDALAVIERLLRGPATPELAEAVATARRRWPNELRARLFEGGWLAKLDRVEQAEACFREAQAEHPHNPWPAVRLTELLLSTGRIEDAIAGFADGVWRGHAPEDTRNRLLSRLCAALPEPARRRAFLSALLDNTPADRFVLLKLAALHFRERERAEADRLFERAKQLGQLPPESQMIELELRLAFARFDEAFDLAMALHNRHPDRPDYARRAIQAAHFAGRQTEMAALLETALTRWPRDWLLLFRYNRTTCPRATDSALFALLAGHEAAAQGDDRWLFQFAVACLRHNRVDRALEILAGFASGSPVAPMAMPLRAALSAHPVSLWRNPRGVSSDPDRDVQVVRVPGAIATVIVMPGVQGGLSYLPFPLVDGLLSRHPVNAIYLRDLHNRGFTAGVRGLGPDLPSTIAGLLAIGDELGVPFVTLGASFGGVSAIRLGVQLGAQAAISFAGPVQMTRDVQDDDAPSPAGRSARGAMLSNLTQEDIDLVALLRTAPRTWLFQCFGAGYAPDVAAADLLRPLPNVVLHAEPDCADHFAVEHMIAGGGFATVLDRAIRSPPPSVAA